MICITECNLAKCLNKPNSCDDPLSLVIGMLTNSTDYTVYIWKESIDAVKAIDVTSDGAGLLTVPLEDIADWLIEDSNYVLWVTLKDANMTDKEDITIGSETVTCLKLNFKNTWDENNKLVTMPSQTIELA